jgi:hypothetical protein
MGTGVPFGGGLLPLHGQVCRWTISFPTGDFQGTHFGPPHQPRRAGERPVSQALGPDN